MLRHGLGICHKQGLLHDSFLLSIGEEGHVHRFPNNTNLFYSHRFSEAKLDPAGRSCHHVSPSCTDRDIICEGVKVHVFHILKTIFLVSLVFLASTCFLLFSLIKKKNVATSVSLKALEKEEE